MMKLKFTLFVVIFLTACRGSDEIKTVDWYKNHKAEREEVRAKCMDNPGELAATPNCLNAIQATVAEQHNFVPARLRK